MYQIACPACGAPVSFRSSAAVMAVCAYCQSSLVRDADSVRDIGKMSVVLADYSPLQVGSSGQYEGLSFNVVGRLQLHYDAGYWNEWYLLFADGRDAWLSDASGLYTFTRRVENGLETVPAFETIQPGSGVTREGTYFVATDIRTAQCVGGEGELPLTVGQGWQAKVADYRNGERFLTLDYSDSAQPICYLGQAVALANLKCQLLRSEAQIAEKMGRLPGSVASLACPNCGAAIRYVAGSAQHLICQTCHAEVSAQPDRVAVLAKHDALQARHTTLEVGDTAKIDQKTWTLIGLMERREIGSGEESSTWVEYLLHHPSDGFLWLVETPEGWDRVTVLNGLPSGAGPEQVKWQGKEYRRGAIYNAEVIWAAGAFNWRIHVGDRHQLIDYTAPGSKLCCERDTAEMVWSVSQTVSQAKVLGWFGKGDGDVAALSGQGVGMSHAASEANYAQRRKIAIGFLCALWAANLPLMFSRGSDALWLPVIASFALWWPVNFGRDTHEDDD